MKIRINDINLLVFYNRNKQKRTEKRKSKLLLSVGVTKSSRRNGKELYTKASIFFRVFRLFPFIFVLKIIGTIYYYPLSAGRFQSVAVKELSYSFKDERLCSAIVGVQPLCL